MGNIGHVGNLAVNRRGACGAGPLLKTPLDPSPRGWSPWPHHWLLLNVIALVIGEQRLDCMCKSAPKLSGAAWCRQQKVAMPCGCKWQRRAQGKPRCTAHLWCSLTVHRGRFPPRSIRPPSHSSHEHGEGLPGEGPPKPGSHRHSVRLSIHHPSGCWVPSIPPSITPSIHPSTFPPSWPPVFHCAAAEVSGTDLRWPQDKQVLFITPK